MDMSHIDLKNNLPGILSLFEYNPETAPALNNLAQVLLRGPSPLKEYERELIASYVSHLNNCNFCFRSHAAATDALFGDDRLTSDPDSLLHMQELSAKMKSLLIIAARVQKSGLAVTENEVNEAKNAGATDKEIHDTVLIAAAFCMYNRYVDGLCTVSSEHKQDYKEIGEMLAEKGYQYTPVAV
jgi:uncharacterized peroxidase-related enzyme